MGNELDELMSSNAAGRDVNVIDKQLPIKVGTGSMVFEILLWCLGIIPGVVFLFMKINAKKYFNQLQQRIQSAASQIDNYLEQRVVILTNCAKLVERSIDLDKSTFENIAKFRSGARDDNARNDCAGQLDAVGRSINVAIENYPELQAHGEIQEAMRQNQYLQKEITAARELYNDVVYAWNAAVYDWPTKMIVAARSGYTTRIPFIASAETKEQARSVMF